jgi:hypothetical protein
VRSPKTWIKGSAIMRLSFPIGSPSLSSSSLNS